MTFTVKVISDIQLHRPYCQINHDYFNRFYAGVIHRQLLLRTDVLVAIIQREQGEDFVLHFIGRTGLIFLDGCGSNESLQSLGVSSSNSPLRYAEAISIYI